MGGCTKGAYRPNGRSLKSPVYKDGDIIKIFIERRYIYSVRKELLVSVDEFSIVLFPPFPIESDKWLNTAYFIISEFLELSKIDALYDVVEMQDKKPSAYSEAYTIDNVPWCFAIATHEQFQHMGVLVKFSAYAWASYQKAYIEKYKKDMNIALFLKMINHEFYTYRLSRIDLTADYKNYDALSPHSIYCGLKDKSCYITDYRGNKVNRKISALQNNMETGTFYVGSRTENTLVLLRVYDKKDEQINKNGFRLNEAMQCNNWTRFEVSFRGDYAHQITEQLNRVNNEIELSQFIATMITNKYRFCDSKTQEYKCFTLDLLSLADEENYSALRSENPKNNSLSKSIAHICKGSGLFPLLYKIGAIWKDNEAKRFLSILYSIYDEYYKKELDRNSQLRSWIRKNYDSLSKQTLESCFVGQSLSGFDIESLCDPEIFNLVKVDTEEPRYTTNNDTEYIDDESFEKMMNF